MRATEIFGPIGEGWGYEVIEEKFIDGKPLTEPVLDERNKQVATRYLRDGEVIKKSLTDAIKKALAMLGFSSDVYMGMHDNAEYIISTKLEFEIKAASEKAEDVSRIRKELDEKFTRHTETMRSHAKTPTIKRPTCQNHPARWLDRIYIYRSALQCHL